MTEPTRTPGVLSPLARKSSLLGLTLAFLVAFTACVGFANILAQRFSPKIDLTAAGEHELSPRTKALLQRLEPSYQIVIATRFDESNRRARRRLADVLDRFVASAPPGTLSTSLIDLSSSDPESQGQRAFVDLQKRLAEREAGTISLHAQALTEAFGVCAQLAEALDRVGTDLEALRDRLAVGEGALIPTRDTLDAGARQSRANARSLSELAEKLRGELGTQQQGSIVPNTPPMIQNLRDAIGSTATYLDAVAEGLGKFALNEQVPKGARDRARPMPATIAPMRDQAARTADQLSRLPALDILRVANVIQSQAAALVIGSAEPPSIATSRTPASGPPRASLNAIPIERLLPNDASPGVRRQDAEELLSTALAALAEPIRPIVVLVHAERSAGLSKAAFSMIADRLALRGVEWIEWACAVEPQPPSLAAFDPTSVRPVIYVVVSTNSAASGQGGTSGVERAQRLGRVLTELVARGESILLSAYPSTLPAFGQQDPIAEALMPLGIRIDSARPVLRERPTTGGRLVEAFTRATPLRGEHPVLNAIGNLPTFFTWPVAVGPAPAGVRAGITITPLYEINDPAAWAESEWMAYAQVPMDQHAPGMALVPANDSAQDLGTGPWSIVATIENRDPSLAKPQRLVVVGSNFWFVNDVIGASSLVDQRPVSANPGNAELFEASMLWLAHQDELIAKSVTAKQVALIQPLSPATLSLLRWGLMAGLPAAALALGVVWRFWRG
jgi:hypothetical protein